MEKNLKIIYTRKEIIILKKVLVRYFLILNVVQIFGYKYDKKNEKLINKNTINGVIHNATKHISLTSHKVLTKFFFS